MDELILISSKPWGLLERSLLYNMMCLVLWKSIAFAEPDLHQLGWTRRNSVQSYDKTAETERESDINSEGESIHLCHSCHGGIFLSLTHSAGFPLARKVFFLFLKVASGKEKKKVILQMNKRSRVERALPFYLGQDTLSHLTLAVNILKQLKHLSSIFLSFMASRCYLHFSIEERRRARG